jgi:biofilm protein TabA
MKISVYSYFLITIFTLIAMSNSNISAGQDVKHWFDKGAWRQGLNILPDETTDKSAFYAEYHKNEALWNKAFDFMKTMNPDKLAVGRTDIAGDDLYAMVSEYTSKNEEDAKFEAHRKYADIQYVLSGEEKIGVVPMKNAQVSVPYDETKDVAFYTVASKTYRPASPKVFFVFLPADVHAPGIKASDNTKVKKLVLKVRLKQ